MGGQASGRVHGRAGGRACVNTSRQIDMLVNMQTSASSNAPGHLSGLMQNTRDRFESPEINRSPQPRTPTYFFPGDSHTRNERIKQEAVLHLRRFGLCLRLLSLLLAARIVRAQVRYSTSWNHVAERKTFQVAWSLWIAGARDGPNLRSIQQNQWTQTRAAAPASATHVLGWVRLPALMA